MMGKESQLSATSHNHERSKDRRAPKGAANGGIEALCLSQQGDVAVAYPEEGWAPMPNWFNQ